MAASSPPFSVLGVHPASVLLLLFYAFGLRLASLTRDYPAWRPVQTRETLEDKADAEPVERSEQPGLWL
jgi:cation:H+ antiporter